MVVVMPLRRKRHQRGAWRLRPEDGRPRCLIEQLAQLYHTNRLGLYVAIVSTMALAGVVLLLLEAAFNIQVGAR